MSYAAPQGKFAKKMKKDKDRNVQSKKTALNEMRSKAGVHPYYRDKVKWQP